MKRDALDALPLPQPEKLTSTDTRPDTREHERRPRRLVRSLVGGIWSSYATPFERAVRAALPWTVWTYPGLRPGLDELFGGRITKNAVDHWRSGKRLPPKWARVILAEYLRGRAAAMLAAADEVQAVGQGERRGVAATAARKAKRRAKAAREV